ncbi:MAG: FimB/Mfa2 family fimbrial subunit [Duncaniella sp.]|nr:FimB/Mfa2 family fimbrial subunit [Duncaniella sp.]
MKLFGRNIISSIIWAALAAVQMVSFASCDSLIYDDLDPCDEGLRLRFVYDYNMEFANAFPSQVDCLTLLVYDKDGNYIETRTVTDRVLLSDEDWRMDVTLPAGTYRLLAYGGLQCEQASFAFMTQPQNALTTVEVGLKPTCITSPVGTRLHDLFYGALEVTVPEESKAYTEATVKMMKDTNNLRIILQNTNNTTVDNSDFTFSLTADNTLFDWQNNIIPTSVTDYQPWTRGQSVAGIDPETAKEFEVAYAEFSVSRLMANADTRLEILRKSDNTKVLSIPLVNYLLLYKSELFADMPSQEYLDRENRWSMILFLQNGYWLSTKIEVNGWTVRINDYHD